MYRSHTTSTSPGTPGGGQSSARARRPADAISNLHYLPLSPPPTSSHQHFRPLITPLIDGLRAHLLLDGPGSRGLFLALQDHFFSNVSLLPGFAVYPCQCGSGDFILDPDDLVGDFPKLATIPTPDLGRPCPSGRHHPRGVHHVYRLPSLPDFPGVSMGLIQYSAVRAGQIIPRSIYAAVNVNLIRQLQVLFPLKGFPEGSYYFPPSDWDSNWLLFAPHRASDPTKNGDLLSISVDYLHFLLGHAVELFVTTVRPAWETVRSCVGVLPVDPPPPRITLNKIEICRDQLLHGPSDTVLEKLYDTSRFFLEHLTRKNEGYFSGYYGPHRRVKVYLKQRLTTNTFLLRLEIVHKVKGIRAACKEAGAACPYKDSLPVRLDGAAETLRIVHALTAAYLQYFNRLRDALPYRDEQYPEDGVRRLLDSLIRSKQTAAAVKLMKDLWLGPVPASRLRSRWLRDKLLPRLRKMGLVFQVGATHGRVHHLIAAAFFKAVTAA